MLTEEIIKKAQHTLYTRGGEINDTVRVVVVNALSEFLVNICTNFQDFVLNSPKSKRTARFTRKYLVYGSQYWLRSAR